MSATEGVLEQLIPGEARTRRVWCPTCERYPGVFHVCTVALDAELHARVDR